MCFLFDFPNMYIRVLVKNFFFQMRGGFFSWAGALKTKERF